MIKNPVEDVLEHEADILALKEWAIDNKINHKALTGLLKILKRRTYPELPAAAKTFLNSAEVEFNIRRMMTDDNDATMGQFVYFGIESALHDIECGKSMHVLFSIILIHELGIISIKFFLS